VGLKTWFTPTTQGLVERYNQTLKQKIFNGFLCNKNKRWLNGLHQYVENINSSRQTTIKEIPLKIQLSDTPQLHSLVESRNKRKTEQAPKFRVGDTV